MHVLEVINVSRDVTWLPWAVQYFFLIGLSVACFFMSLPAAFCGTTGADRFARLALVGALVSGVVAPVALLADLHQPGRFWRFYAHPNLSSWMAWGAFFIPGYLGGLFVYAWAALKPELAASGRGAGPVAALHRRLAPGDGALPGLVRIAGAWTVLLALLVLLYTGMEVMVVRARPLWNTPLLPLQFAATALTGAAGLVLVLDRLTATPDGRTEAQAAFWLKAGLIPTLLLGLIWFALGWLGLNATHAQALASVAGQRHWQIIALWAAAATLVPLVLLWLRPLGFGWLLGLIGLHAAWMFRWTVFIGGQIVPKTGAGAYTYDLPLGRDGLMGIAGTFGLWIAVFIIVTALMPGPQTPARPSRSFAPAE